MFVFIIIMNTAIPIIIVTIIFVIAVILSGLYFGGVFTKSSTTPTGTTTGTTTTGTTTAATTTGATTGAGATTGTTTTGATTGTTTGATTGATGTSIGATADTVKVSFYVDGFGSQGVDLGPGKYDTAQLGIPNDSLSSIRIPAGRTVQIFEDSGFSGKSQTYTSDVASLGGTVWNDVASSWIIT